MFKEKNDFLDEQYKEEAKNDMFGENNRSSYGYKENNYNSNSHSTNNYNPNKYKSNNENFINYKNTQNRNIHPYANNNMGRNQHQNQMSDSKKVKLILIIGVAAMAFLFICTGIASFLESDIGYEEAEMFVTIAPLIPILIIFSVAIYLYNKKNKNGDKK